MNNHPTGRHGGVAGGLFAAAFAAALCTAALADPQSPQIGRQAPDCTLTLASGARTGIAKYRGKVVYVDFWASWCAPCQLSFPFMDQLNRQLAANGLQIVAIDMDEKAGDAARFLAAHSPVFAVALGDNAQCARDFGVSDMPSSYLVDRDGIIREVHHGFREGDGDGLRALAEQLLKQPAGK